MARLGVAGLGLALVIGSGGCRCGGAGSGASPPSGPPSSSSLQGGAHPLSTSDPSVSSTSAASASPTSEPAPSDASASPARPGSDLAPIEHLFRLVRRGGGRDLKFVPPDPAETRTYGVFIAALVRRVSDPAAPPADTIAREVGRLPPGFEVKPLLGRGDLLAVVERDDQRRGAGALLLRVGPARRLVVEAPHTFYDGGTLPIGIAAFEGLKARALLINTVHRYAATNHKPPGDDEAGGSASDVAHIPMSHFGSAHEALLDVDPRFLTLQLHGFKDESAPGVDMVLSPSRTKLDVAPIAARLREHLTSVEIRTYPTEIDKLGGTTNVQAAVSTRRRATFLHVEMSRSLRSRLEKDPRPLVEGLRVALPDDAAR
ncbi:hypothetical protein [Chondromyces crocatus]|uniref:Uncharacterized protein n=1 Tax=Chondromyces crocatus TaxID=52 RepID=A0A0K1EMG7_CHOCO|nr:hypothetical protein [Chondromyces crocatus]AKT42085.1 uncharacterized protein CMC5_063080 [Chondromyces crocatus]